MLMVVEILIRNDLYDNDNMNRFVWWIQSDQRLVSCDWSHLWCKIYNADDARSDAANQPPGPNRRRTACSHNDFEFVSAHEVYSAGLSGGADAPPASLSCVMVAFNSVTNSARGNQLSTSQVNHLRGLSSSQIPHRVRVKHVGSWR